MNKRFIYTSYGAIMDTSKTPEEGQIIFDEDIDGLGEMCNLLNKQNEEIERWKAHKEWDCKTIQELGDKIEDLETKLAESEREVKKLRRRNTDAYLKYYHSHKEQISKKRKELYRAKKEKQKCQNQV